MGAKRLRPTACFPQVLGRRKTHPWPRRRRVSPMSAAATTKGQDVRAWGFRALAELLVRDDRIEDAQPVLAKESAGPAPFEAAMAMLPPMMATCGGHQVK